MDFFNQNIETHPFNDFVRSNTEYLIIGTFPSYNRTFDFYYSGAKNRFWDTLGRVFNYSFVYKIGFDAVNERMDFLNERRIGITDMILKCYRKGHSSDDEDLYPIVLNDIFKILSDYRQIKRLVLTSRSGICSTLGLLNTYFIQQGLELQEPKKKPNNILIGCFNFKGREIEVYVPISPSAKVDISLKELTAMYSECLK